LRLRYKLYHSPSYSSTGGALATSHIEESVHTWSGCLMERNNMSLVFSTKSLRIDSRLPAQRLPISNPIDIITHRQMQSLLNRLIPASAQDIVKSRINPLPCPPAKHPPRFPLEKQETTSSSAKTPAILPQTKNPSRLNPTPHYETSYDTCKQLQDRGSLHHRTEMDLPGLDTREPLHGADPLEWAREWVDMRVFQVEIGGYATRDG
jgi:hypothetical protein